MTSALVGANWLADSKVTFPCCVIQPMLLLCHVLVLPKGFLSSTLCFSDLVPPSFLSLRDRCLNPSLPVAVPRCLAWLMLRIWSVEMRSSFLVYTSRPFRSLLLMLWPPRMQIMMMEFRKCQPMLLWFLGISCDSDDEVSILHLLLSCPLVCLHPGPHAGGRG
jgi:hypothetical protein